MSARMCRATLIARHCLVYSSTTASGRKGPGAPVVFLSGRGEDPDIARAFEMGADDYLVKPFSPTELTARARAALRRRAASRGHRRARTLRAGRPDHQPTENVSSPSPADPSS